MTRSLLIGSSTNTEVMSDILDMLLHSFQRCRQQRKSNRVCGNISEACSNGYPGYSFAPNIRLDPTHLMGITLPVPVYPLGTWVQRKRGTTVLTTLSVLFYIQVVQGIHASHPLEIITGYAYAKYHRCLKKQDTGGVLFSTSAGTAGSSKRRFLCGRPLKNCQQK